MRMKSAKIFLAISYKKMLACSVLMIIVVGVGFAGFLLPKIIRQVMRMVWNVCIYSLFFIIDKIFALQPIVIVIEIFRLI